MIHHVNNENMKLENTFFWPNKHVVISIIMQCSCREAVTHKHSDE